MNYKNILHIRSLSKTLFTS